MRLAHSPFKRKNITDFFSKLQTIHNRHEGEEMRTSYNNADSLLPNVGLELHTMATF